MPSVDAATVLQQAFDPVPRAVLFDLDDTLCDYASARVSRLRHAFTLHQRDGVGSPATGRLDLDAMVAESLRMHPHGADHFGELFQTFGLRDPGSAEAAAAWYRQHRFHDLELFPDAILVLRAVRRTRADRGGPPRPIGIVTNGPADVQRAKIDLLGVAELVDFAIISGELGIAKPDPRIFQEALRRAGVRASEAVFIGDAPEFDIAGAHAAGIPSVWLSCSGAGWSEPSFAPDRIIQTIAEVPALVGSSVPVE